MIHRYQHAICAGLQSLILLFLRGYKKYISPFLPSACRFEPTCSVYMYQAIQKKGIIRGLYWGIRRILRCHPFCEGGFDPFPE
ncbi:MAG: membrane protein insertion efficiency factor YidD [Acidobacteria bacterium]|nr:membrane protein insertion efficiency factor YidD [Acidobacteriota bacterium]